MKRTAILFALGLQTALASSAGAFTLTVIGGTGGGTYGAGEVVQITATPPSAEYRFDHWSGDIASIEDDLQSPTRVTVNADITLTANFVQQYTLAITGGHTVGDPGPYDLNDVVQIAADVLPGNAFLQWTGDIASVDNPAAANTSIQITGNLTLAASFVPLIPQYTLTVDGVVYGPFDQGTVLPLHATVPASRTFTGWVGDIAFVADPTKPDTTVTVSQNLVLSTGLKAQYLLTVISGAGSGTYDEGTLVTIEANTPPDGKVFDQWIGDVAGLENVNAVTTALTVTGSRVITATYKDIVSNSNNNIDDNNDQEPSGDPIPEEETGQEQPKAQVPACGFGAFGAAGMTLAALLSLSLIQRRRAF